jgi:transaldolase / glucose-6-phosphate isomerase
MVIDTGAYQVNTVKVRNPLKELQTFGQSVWFDYVRRNLLTSGELNRLIKDDGLRGMTSNPAIFEKAIVGSTDYDQAIEKLAGQDLDAASLYEKLAIEDIQKAADILRSVYHESHGEDGYVSLEVSPYLANDTQASIVDARRLWGLVQRPNVMIKVPGTKAGVPAVETLISEGININVTLLFSQQAYLQVAEAFIKGLETFAAKGGDPSKVASVASFFVSRIDTAVDNILSKRIEQAENDAQKKRLQGLLGQVAICNAKQAYQLYKNLYKQARWLALQKRGARPQRLLWASTGTKNPHYSDVLYVDELIGPNTVNTVPPATFDAYRDHGKPQAGTLESNLDQANSVMSGLSSEGISLEEVCEKLVADGVTLFADAFDKLLGALEKKREGALQTELDNISYHVDQVLAEKLKTALEDWRAQGKVRRLWAFDASLWTNSDESKWLGWLGVTYDQLAHIKPLQDLAQEIKQAGFKHVLLLGMGGSSLGPEVLQKSFGQLPGFPQFHVLDSTDPAQVLSFEKIIDLGKTLFIVSSKSGSTLEPNIFKQYFYERVKESVGADKAGQQFIAITDPGSHMEKVAKESGFRHIFYGLPSIGGRYSVLSNFGMVPAAVMGIDVAKFLDRTERMVHACAASVPPDANPGVLLGAIMGVSAISGRDKVTICASPAIDDLGAWLEQLLAESTGKIGKGLIPVDREPIGSPDLYGNDRLFCYLRLRSKPDESQDKAIDRLEQAGHPVVRISLEDNYDIGQEFFRWEIATAVAGSLIGINAFNQPDVEASKIVTRELTTEYEKSGKLPAETPIFEGDGIKLYTDPVNATELETAVGKDKSLTAYFKAHFSRLKPGDYAALLAYIERNAEHEQELQKLRSMVRDKKKVATCVGFGPRFLHSTGQAYKGGPNSGVFLQVTADDAKDIPVPGQKYTFGVVKAAQARGDFAVLTERKRRALRVHLGTDIKNGLSVLTRALEKALS